MDYEKEASKVLDSRGHKPSRPQVLSLMGDIVNNLYDEMYDNIKKDEPELSSIEMQRGALDFTFKKLSVIKMDEWRKSFETNGYVKMFSPMLALIEGETGLFYLCRDEIFDSIKDRFEEVIYKASELPVLKELESEDIQCLHMGKKVMKGSILL
jgi:hypothetical protein